MDVIEIEIVNWEKYNPRTDRKKSSWFRLENGIAAEPKFFGLSASQKFVAICIFAEASKNCGAAASINVDWLADQLKIKPAEIHKTIQHLVSCGVVKVSAGVAVVSSGCPTNVRTYERTNVRTDIAIASQSPAMNPVKIYCEHYKSKYGHNPAIGGKQSGILIRFAKDHPNRWPELLEGYLRMPDSWAVARSHPVELLETKVNEIVRFLETGKVVTKKVVQHAEEMIDKAQGTNKKPRKSIDELERERAEMMADANVVPMIGGKG